MGFALSKGFKGSFVTWVTGITGLLIAGCNLQPGAVQSDEKSSEKASLAAVSSSSVSPDPGDPEDQADPAEQTDQAYLEITSDRAAGVRVYLRHAQGYTNTDYQDVGASGGTDHLELYLKRISGDVQFSGVQVLVNAGGKLYYSEGVSAYAPVGSDWVKISLPISALKATTALDTTHLARGVSEVGLIYRGGSGVGGVIGLDEIRFTGGPSAFVWYGESHPESGLPESIREQNPAVLFVSARPTTGGASSVPTEEPEPEPTPTPTPTNPPAEPNQVPVVQAPADQSITLPTNSLVLEGSASDADGSIESVSWTQLSGPSAQLSGSATLSLSLSNLVEGTYSFRLTATDNVGESASDDVAVTVHPAPSTPPPTGGLDPDAPDSELGNYTPVPSDGTLTAVAVKSRVIPGSSPAIKNPYGYWEYLPKSYASSPERSYPVVLFLHGVGEKGSGSLSALQTLLNTNGTPLSLLRDRVAFLPEEAIVLSPQSWSGFWNPNNQGDLPGAFMIFAMNSYRIDPKRVYITGLSAGDYGTWVYLSNHNRPNHVIISSTCPGSSCSQYPSPSKYAPPPVPAAAVPVSGNANSNVKVDPCDLKEIPIWVFHGNRDRSPNDPFAEQSMIERINTQCNPRAQIRWTNFSDLSHNSWSRTYTQGTLKEFTIVPDTNHDSVTVKYQYSRKKVWDWLFRQVRD